MANLVPLTAEYLFENWDDHRSHAGDAREFFVGIGGSHFVALALGNWEEGPSYELSEKGYGIPLRTGPTFLDRARTTIEQVEGLDTPIVDKDTLRRFGAELFGQTHSQWSTSGPGMLEILRIGRQGLDYSRGYIAAINLSFDAINAEDAGGVLGSLDDLDDPKKEVLNRTPLGIASIHETLNQQGRIQRFSPPLPVFVEI